MKKIVLVLLMLLIVMLNGCSKDDINNHLMEVEINKDNFYDYFDLVYEPARSMENQIVFGLHSKMYDEGYVIYACEPVYLYVAWPGDYKKWIKYEPLDLLTIMNSCGLVTDEEGNIVNISIVDFRPGKITYIDKDYIKSYEYDYTGAEYYERQPNAVITLKNKEVIKRFTDPEHPY